MAGRCARDLPNRPRPSILPGDMAGIRSSGGSGGERPAAKSHCGRACAPPLRVASAVAAHSFNPLQARWAGLATRLRWRGGRRQHDGCAAPW